MMTRIVIESSVSSTLMLLSFFLISSLSAMLQSEMPVECREECIRGLSQQPFYVDISSFGYEATFSGSLSEKTEVSSRSGERFRPLIVERVIVNPTPSPQ